MYSLPKTQYIRPLQYPTLLPGPGVDNEDDDDEEKDEDDATRKVKKKATKESTPANGKEKKEKKPVKGTGLKVLCVSTAESRETQVPCSISPYANHLPRSGLWGVVVSVQEG